MLTTPIHNVQSKPWLSVGQEDIWGIEESSPFEELHKMPNREIEQILLHEQEWERIFHLGNSISIVGYSLLHVEDGSGLISEIEETLKWLQSNDVVVPELTQVREYLIEYPDIIHVLLPTCYKVRQEFLLPDQLSLELYHDPEIDDEHLTLYVRQEHYDDSIMDVIDSVSAEHEEELSSTSGWMSVTTDFAPPR